MKTDKTIKIMVFLLTDTTGKTVKVAATAVTDIIQVHGLTSPVAGGLMFRGKVHQLRDWARSVGVTVLAGTKLVPFEFAPLGILPTSEIDEDAMLAK